MNAIDLLEQQHQETSDLFDAFEEAGGSDDKQRVVRQIIDDLRVHTAIEEEIFYPAVRELLGMDDEIDEDLEEHHVVEVLLDELDEMTPGDDRYDAKVEVLRELVDHHVEEEEEELFPEVRDEMDEDELEELGERMQQRAEQLRGGGANSDTTKEELYKRAQELDVDGRSKMSKRELLTAVENAR